RLGERRRRHQLAARDFRQEALLLLLGAVGADEGAGDEVACHHRADAEPSARQLLGDNRHRGVVEAHPALLFWKNHAEVAELGHLLEDVFGDFLVLTIEVVGDRFDFLLDEVADRAAYLLVLLGNKRHDVYRSYAGFFRIRTGRSYSRTFSPAWLNPVVRNFTTPRSGREVSRLDSTSDCEVSVSPGYTVPRNFTCS